MSFNNPPRAGSSPAGPGLPASGDPVGPAAPEVPAAPRTPRAAGTPGHGRPAGSGDPRRSPAEGTPGAPGRAVRRRVPELAVGVVLIGLGAIGALMLAGRQPPRAAVLVWANDMSRGQVVVPDDLTVASIESDTPVDVVDVAAADDVVGRTVAFGTSAGGFVSGSLLEVGSTIPPDYAVVGLRLGAGRYPVSTLSVGDVVDLLTSEPLIGWDDPVVVSGVEVFDMLWLGGGEGSDALVSLLVPRAAAPRVVAAAAAGPRLAEVDS